MKLNELKPAAGSVRAKKRIGRGIGSGHGKTAGRGHKGRGSRSGGNTPPGYEGGQMPLQRRLPKRGFRRLQKNAARRKDYAAINLRSLAVFGDGAAVDPAILADRGLVKAGQKVKVLGDGDLAFKLTVRAQAFSKRAREKINAVGGVAELIEDSPRTRE
ncbi:MAG: 50S ribosomal protein L15 [Deltaproteobacteria bacterium]|nr:50S ribosomal protein L15 [Deltaproteobacteria bacterium]MBV8452521.1 50S ribosomal protein L15 [Deltaproteobacteria bacterium]